MQPQRNCEHTVSGAAGWYCSGQTVRCQPSLRGSVRRASAAILHAPALCGCALPCRRWPGSRLACALCGNPLLLTTATLCAM